MADHLFSFKDVARVFALKESRLRYWAQTGFVSPSARQGGKRVYTFTDLLEVKAAKELLDAGIPLQRVRKNLHALRAALPDEPHPLLQIRCDGETLHVTEGQTAFNPLSGQLLLDFAVDEVQKQVGDILQLAGWKTMATMANGEEAAAASDRMEDEPPPGRATDADVPDQAGACSAYSWFLRGAALDEEAGQETAAAAAYERAIALDPALAAAYTNLGNLRYRLGERAAAIACYETACTLDPEQPEAHYNLGNIYEEEGDLEMAIAEYRRALRLLPDFADVHFNLALVLERVGSRVQAAEHWRRYMELTQETRETHPWRSVAQDHLAQLRA